MEGLPNNSAHLTEKFPQVCIDTAELHEVLEVRRSATRPYLNEAERFEPRRVLEIADRLGRSGQLPDSLNHVAATLLTRCEDQAPEAAGMVKSQIQDFFEERQPSNLSGEELLKRAKRSLPRSLFEEVALVLGRG